ncbi:zinc metalloprotease [Spirochaetia bacterium]|nr:zinc metalloprotease [Spirochaetia bacterium]GHU32446.1 zinc metalloprotease [Spirochaetia bacterium]
MLFIRILLGIAGLGVVVFVHELGHFLAARLMGVTVEAFCIGWGKTILKKKIGDVEYRLGLFPVGGYCKMKGENEFREAYESNQKAVAPAPDTFLGAPPWRRIIISFAGPFFNVVFAVVALACVWGVGFNIQTVENRIVLASALEPGGDYPADRASLETGDRIIEIAGKPVENYRDIQENIAINPEKALPVTVERDGEIHALTLTPALDKSTATGKIGVYYWADPVVSEVVPGSAAERAGIQTGDRILSVNGTEIPYTVAMIPVLQERPELLTVEYQRGRNVDTVEIPLSYTDSGETNLGIAYQTVQYHTPRLNPVQALAKGAQESVKTFALSVKSLGLLFRGIDLTQAVSGPVRITMMIGEAATSGFSESVGTGFLAIAEFLALISISLGVMNLLPLPILDGGMILLFIIEAIRHKPINPRAINAFQMVGVVLIFGLMAFALFGDIRYLIH